MNVVDPLGQGFVASLAKPGGNVTGFSNFEPSLVSKWVELLKEVSPRVKRVDVVFNPDTAPYFPLFLQEVQNASAPLGITPNAVKVHDPVELERAVQDAGTNSTIGMVVPIDTFTSVHPERLIALATLHRVPAVYASLMFNLLVDPIIGVLDLKGQSRHVSLPQLLFRAWRR